MDRGDLKPLEKPMFSSGRLKSPLPGKDSTITITCIVLLSELDKIETSFMVHNATMKRKK